MRTFIIAAAAVLIAAPGVVRAAEPPCLAKSEFIDLAGFTLPSLIGGAKARCGPVLGPEVFLPTGEEELVERYAARQDTTWPGAMAAFLKISSKTDGKANDILKQLPEETLKDMLTLMIEGMVSQEIPTEMCGSIDEFARLLSPLPAENTAELISLILALASKPKPDGSGKSTIGKLAICRD